MSQTLKLASWNVNGIRAVAKKGFHAWLDNNDFDIVCLQESKAEQSQLDESLLNFEKYPSVTFSSAERKGYSGVVNLFSETARPLDIKLGFDVALFDKKSLSKLNENMSKANLSVTKYHISEQINSRAVTGSFADRAESKGDRSEINLAEEIDVFNREGRIIHSEHSLGSEKFSLFNIYFPNGGSGPDRLDFKLRFYEVFLEYIQVLSQKNPNIIITGDYNTAHHPIDLARPKENEGISGFMPVERAYLDRLEALGYTDSFRHFYPETPDRYTWWSYRSAARARNIGWRIDYFYVSKPVLAWLKSAEIHDSVEGSDHCPVSISLTN